MNATEAAHVLGVSDVNYVYRLLRSGAIAGHREGAEWVVDDASVEQRRQRMAQAARSKANIAAERERRKAEIRERYAKP